jgi:hypothetical protein
MIDLPKVVASSHTPLTLREAIKDLVIILGLSSMVIGLVVVLHTVLPPIG